MSTFEPDPPNVYRNRIVRISELATVDDVLVELVFEKCEIVGPAVLAILGGNQIRHVNIDSVNALWDIPVDRRYVGAIGLQACLFEDCSFRRCGFVGPPDVMAKFRQAFTTGA